MGNSVLSNTNPQNYVGAAFGGYQMQILQNQEFSEFRMQSINKDKSVIQKNAAVKFDKADETSQIL